ncbi:MAG: right-handed parallel beta-helix repeat-containing protein [Thermoanaerobaculia bacterium]
MIRAPLFLSLLLALPAFGTLVLQIVPPASMGDDLHAEWRVIAANRGHETIEDFPLLMWASVSIVAMPHEFCAPEADGTPRINARCIFDLPAGATRELTFTAKYDRRFGRFTGQVLGGPLGDLYERDEAMFGPGYVVTSTADSGPGSLRQTILEVNRDCTDYDTPCVITFALDDPQPATLRPETALPAITAAAVRVDGGSRVAIDGSATPAGHGLLLEGPLARVTGLAIRGFRGNGIEANGFASIIRDNDLRANGLRGVQVNGGESLVFDNVLSGNLRAGGFFWSSREVRVRRNVVTGNGASGLFFHKPAVSRIASFAEDNVVAFNAHAGIALSLTADGHFAQNTFHDNLGAPIDVGLDGNTRDTRAGLPGQGGRIGAPILTSARFDGTATVVTGRVSGRSTSSLIHERVYLYAGARPDTAEEVVAAVDSRGSRFPELTFTARIERDLRGQWIHGVSSTTYLYNWDDFARGTSELSVPLPVE